MISFCLGLIVSDGYLFYFIWNKRTKPLQRGPLKYTEEEDQGVHSRSTKTQTTIQRANPVKFFEQLSLFLKLLLDFQ
jgi:hypothetical protein